MSPLEDVVELLGELVSIKSVNPAYDPTSDEKELIEFIKSLLAEWDIPFDTQEVENGRQNIIARIEGSSDRRLLFEAHLDTVSVDGMEIDPFSPQIKEGFLYGRGACDTKGGLAAMLGALWWVRKSDKPPESTIVLAATVDEEHAFTGVQRLVEAGIRAEGAVVAEPTSLDVIIAHKGCLRWRIITRGRASHSSKAHLGVNAVLKMMRLINGIEEKLVPALKEKSHQLLGPPTLNIGRIKGGRQINIVPDCCVIELDRRLLPGETRQSVYGEFGELISALEDEDPELRVEMEAPMLEDPAMETNEEELVVRVAGDACREVLGTAAFVGVPFGTDASKLSRAGIPSIVLGPGSIDQAHGAIEFVSIEQVSQAQEIYYQMMMSF